MIVPDYISPVVGYRVWHWDSTGVNSLNGAHWLPRNPFLAECKAQRCHEAPHEGCTCGVYAAKSVDHLHRTGYEQYGVTGEVYLWGTVVEHEQGWRAQFAYPKKLVLPTDMVPFTMSRVESWLTTLAAYGCDIFVLGKTGNVPLWLKGTGYDSAGLALLVQRSRDWYARRAQERQIKPGDRVAVRGRGIAIVEMAGDRQVHAVLWNRDRLRIERRLICWDEQNMRWETAVVTATGNNGLKEAS